MPHCGHWRAGGSHRGGRLTPAASGRASSAAGAAPATRPPVYLPRARAWTGDGAPWPTHLSGW
eukprot:6262753-Pyramimonas_sp.AAC.1